jgi:phosphatidylserine decarboxylase
LEIVDFCYNFFQGLTTNTTSTFPSGSYYDHDFSSEKKRRHSIQLTKGQLVGDFNLGSTIVLLFEAPDGFTFTMKPGQRLKYGQGIGSCGRLFKNQRNKRR